MRPRFRTLAALLALIALSIAQVEPVWATACAPGRTAVAHGGTDIALPPDDGRAPAHEVGATADGAGAHHEAPRHDSATVPAGAPAPAGDTDHAPAAPCSDAAMTAGCGATVPLPGGGVVLRTPDEPRGSGVSPATDRVVPLLLGSTLFRPPRQ